MSLPLFLPINPSITLCREQSALLILSSIAFEELGLAHVISAEAKLQSALGRLGPNSAVAPNFNALITSTLQTILKKEMLLQFKLEEAIEKKEIDRLELFYWYIFKW